MESSNHSITKLTKLICFVSIISFRPHMFVNLLHILSIHVHTSLTKINEIVKYSIFNITRNTSGKNNNKEESVRQILGHIFKQKLIKSQTQKHDAPENKLRLLSIG